MVRSAVFILCLFCTAGVLASPVRAEEPVAKTSSGPTFEIRQFVIEGNTLYPVELLDELLMEYTGPEKTAAVVEEARTKLEKFYQENGFLRVMVNIPEQMVEGGEIRLKVIESRIGQVLVNENRYFTKAGIMEELPALQPGKIIYIPDVEEQLNTLNANPDLTVRLKLEPAREMGVDDIVLTVEDRMPLHASVEINNRSTHDTSELRLNAMIRYDNLWQRKHSASFQYQTAPLEPSEVQVMGGSYVLPTPWRKKQYLAGYALWTDSETAFGEGFNVIGKGFILGARYLVPLDPYKKYYHSISFGVDYKDFEETLGFVGEDEEDTETPISYLPFSIGYNGTLRGKTGTTRLQAALNWHFRGLVGSEEEFAGKRYQARGDYFYLNIGLEREQELPWHMDLALAVKGQVASEPLISSEQFSAGGMESVRGYKESDSLGDNGVRASIEWLLPDVGKLAGWESWMEMRPYLFYDYARLWVKDPLPEQTDEFELQGTGLGLRGKLWEMFDYEVDLAMALSATARADSGDIRGHFRLKYHF
jgi:hemolysin activation/secretion protein